MAVTAPVSTCFDRLLDLSRQLGREERKLAILGEGNTSARKDAASFWVKASGANLGSLSPAGLTACRFSDLLALLDRPKMADHEVDEALLAARLDKDAKKPSVEAIFHAYLLTLPDVHFVGHTHPVAVNALMCTSMGRTFARRRIFPDEVVCCGAESVLVPYTDPGLKLAQRIRAETQAYIRRLARPPRLILLENHGLIALGSSPESVLASTLMAVKAAEILSGALATGARPRFLTAAQVLRIAGRPDEHYRQKALGF